MPSQTTETTLPGSSARLSLLAIIAGLLLGLTTSYWPANVAAPLLGGLDLVGAIWVTALRWLVVPLVVSTLLVAIGERTATTGRLAVLMAATMIALLAMMAIGTLAAGASILQLLPTSTATQGAFAAAIASPASLPAVPASAAADWLQLLSPANWIAALLRGDLLALIVVAMLFGFGLRYLPQAYRVVVLAIATTVSHWSLRLAGVLFRVMPLAVLALVVNSTASSGPELAAGIVYYIVWVCILLLLGIVVIYAVVAFAARIAPADFARAAWPVQVLAFSTRSSVACLPAMLDAARNSMSLPPKTVDFVLPVAVSTFKLNMGISAVFQMLFLLHVYGLSPGMATLGIATATLAAQSLVTPGLPSGALWTTTPVYLSLGIPIEGIVLTTAVDTIPDLFKTTLNVTGNLGVAAVVSRNG